MTTLDGEERTPRPRDGPRLRPRTGPPGIAGIMGGQVSEVSEQTTAVLLEVANWNGTNILRTSRMLGLRSEASSRFEKQLHPDLCMRAQAIASRLMVELCGAKLVPGTIDVAAEPAGADRARPAGLPGHRPARDGDRPGRPGRLPGAARLRGRAGRRRAGRHGAARPPLRRHPRGRPDRGGRPRPRPRREPALDPARIRRAARRAEPRAAPAPPRRGHDAGPRLRRNRRLELHRPRRAAAAADPAGRRPRQPGS